MKPTSVILVHAGIALALVLLGLPAHAQECERKNLSALGETTLAEMAAVFTASVDQLPQLEVDADRATGKTTGHYLPENATIMIRCGDQNVSVWQTVIRHEYAHHYLYRVFGALPGWLDEGVASHFEAPPSGAGRQVNAGRLQNFISLLKRGQVPDLEFLFSFAPHESLATNNSNYSVGWALVHALLHPGEDADKEARHRTLHRLLASYRRGESPVDAFLAALGLSDPKSLKAWQRAWHLEIWNLR